MGWRAALAAVVIALIAPAAARAATVRVVWLPCGHHHGECPSELRYTAAAGEANDVTLRIEGGEMFVGDAGAPLTAGGGVCRALTAHEVVCETDSSPELTLGDGDDRAQITGDPSLVDVDAGPGADVVVGGPGTEHITAGPGADTLLGGAGNDFLYDGVRERYEADVFDGGEGRDMVTWEGRRRAVVSGLAGLAGSPGEDDRLVAVESLAGGRGDDRLWGDEGFNVLVGGGGDDRLDGGAGNDTLAGGPGDDVVSGGPGTDNLNPHGGDPGNWEPGGSDRLACGADRDRANQVRARDRVADGCEVVDGGPATFDLLLPQATLEAPVLRVRWYSCVDPEPCRIRMTIRSRARLLGRVRARIPGIEGRLPLRLSARGRRILRRERRVPVAIAFRSPFERAEWRVVLRAPGSAQ